MQIHSLLDGIDGLSVFAVDDDAVALEKNVLHEMGEVLFFLDDPLSHHLAGFGAELVKFQVPELKHTLALEPVLDNEKTVDDA